MKGKKVRRILRVGYPLGFSPTGEQRGQSLGCGCSHIPTVVGNTYGHPGQALSVKPMSHTVALNIKGRLSEEGFVKTFGNSEDGNIKRIEENGHEKPKNIGVILPSGKRVKLTHIPLRTETAYLEIKNKFPLTLWRELNGLHAQHISQLAAYQLEKVRDFIQSNGKRKPIAYRKEGVSQEKTKEDAREC
jgi:hypothetical protein